jgi:mono-ADP-ribosyltransferase sirtuin 6
VGTYEKGDNDHATGRKCALCCGVLLDTIINFGESLPERALQLARDHADKADLCIVLGSSLTVTPANEIPETVGQKRGAKLAICNLQKTPIDQLTDIRIFAEADVLMTKVMEKLGIPVPPFMLQRRLVIKVESPNESRHRITARGIDYDGTPVSFLQSVRLEGSRRVVRAEPFLINMREDLQHGAQLKFELEFMGHYNEPKLELTHEYQGEQELLYLLIFDPQTGIWKVEKQDSLITETASLTLESSGTAGNPIDLE